MNTKSPTRPASSFDAKSILLRNKGRIIGLVVITLTLAVLSISTIGLAQTNQKLLRDDAIQPQRSSVEAPSKVDPSQETSSISSSQTDMVQRSGLEGRGKPRPDGRPNELRLSRARTFQGDLRQLPVTSPVKTENLENDDPDHRPQSLSQADALTFREDEQVSPSALVAGPSVTAPAPTANFEGLDFTNWGNDHPAEPVGDVGPNHYVQAINGSFGIYDKATGTRLVAMTFNALMSQGNFGNLCDTNNTGDAIVLYDTFEDRWILTDVAMSLTGGAVSNPPGSFQCFAVSRTGDPVSGGWNFYSLNMTDFRTDYPKFGIWPDGLYMSANLFGFPAGGAYAGPRVWALNKAQMYAGAPTVQSVTFNGPLGDYTLLPSNARLQTGTPPAGTPNYFLSTWQFTNAVTVYKFHVDWDKTALSSFTGPSTPMAASGWPGGTVPNAPSLGGNILDVVPVRAMMQNQYTNIGGVESLWATHTVSRAAGGFAAPRFYQVEVTGGTVAANMIQAATFDPDAANVIHRFMPSLAVDRAGNMALGYSTSSSTTKPAIKYAGRLSTDPINTFSQTEQVLIEGAGTQTGNCGGAPCSRWGDYSAMTVDPDGCTFWYTNMYYATDGLDYQTRIGSFTLPQCTTIGNGSVQGTVTVGGVPLNGATVALGSRVTTTDATGFYSFANIPAGTYPSATASFAGYGSSTVINLVVNEASITTQNFDLSAAANDGCFTDTSQSDFQNGVATNVDLNSSPGNISLLNPETLDQQNLSVTSSGFAINVTNWTGQTFTPASTGKLTKAEVTLFCSGCTGTTPNLNVSVRATSGDLPTGPDLASATLPGFSSAAAVSYTVNFAVPPTLTGGTRYALLVRPVANPSAGLYAYVVSAGNNYTNGRWVLSSTSGSSWTAGLSGGTPRDMGFKTFMKTGYGPGNLVSGLKDANPHTGGGVAWTTLSWNASTPAGTSVKFQVAASNSVSGPFNFVGPDGTAATFFTTSGASLSQFDGLRYLKYRATLETTNTAVTPVLNDVTVCFNNTVPTTMTVDSATGTYGGTVNLSAKLTDGVSPLAGKTVAFSLNGNSVGNAVTDAAGVASMMNVSLAGIDAGTYATGVGASFAGDAPHLGSSGTGQLTVNKADAVINVVGYSGVYDGAAHGASGTATGVNGEDLSSLLDFGMSFMNVPGGNAHWTFNAGDVNGNYNQSSGDVAITIMKADAVTNVVGYSGVYDGAAHGASGTATGVNGEDLSSLLDFGTTYTNVPGGNAHWTFNAGDVNGNYNQSSGDVAITIMRADAVINVAGYTGVYDGGAHGASGTATGVNGEDLSSLLDFGMAFMNVPGGNAHWTFNAGDVNGNYNQSSGDVAITIMKADAVVNVVGYSGVYDAGAHGASGTATGVNGEDLSSLLDFGMAFMNVPGGNAHWTFNAGDVNGNYNQSSGDVAITIMKATPVFSNLSSPTIDCGPPTTNLSGQINLGALIPTGGVDITLDGVTQTAAIQGDGTFSAAFATPTNSPLGITYSYAGDTNFFGITGSGTLTGVNASPPVITLNGNVISLWPFNKSFRTVSVTDLVASASDGCDTSIDINDVVIANVTSDEGNSGSGDINIAGDCKSVQLRADRNGNGNGRVYTITFKLQDASGNTTTASAQVIVPHNNGGNAVDSGIAYTVNSDCP